MATEVTKLRRFRELYVHPYSLVVRDRAGRVILHEMDLTRTEARDLYDEYYIRPDTYTCELFIREWARKLPPFKSK